MHLFTDGSAEPQSKIGYGAYLLLKNLTKAVEMPIQTRRFEGTTSSRLELEVLLWALTMMTDSEIIVYTDSQTIVGLEARRERLEKANFCNKKGEPLHQADLYRAFYRQIDQMNCIFVKVKGHSKSSQKTAVERIFTLVDKASRDALRNDLKS